MVLERRTSQNFDDLRSAVATGGRRLSKLSDCSPKFRQIRLTEEEPTQKDLDAEVENEKWRKKLRVKEMTRLLMG